MSKKDKTSSQGNSQGKRKDHGKGKPIALTNAKEIKNAKARKAIEKAIEKGKPIKAINSQGDLVVAELEDGRVFTVAKAI